jgi:hypothetical protein
MSKIGTLTTGAASVDTFDLTYVPEFLFYAAGTQLTSLKVSVLGDGVICDLDGAGLSVVGTLGLFGQVTNGYIIPLADGLIKGKNVEIITTNSAAQTPVLYGVSNNYGSVYIQSLRSKALANSGAEFTKFAAWACPAIASGDILTVNYVDGFTANHEFAELPALASMTQNDATADILNNFDGNIDSVQFTPAADRTVYTVRYSGAMLNQSM